MGPVKTLSSVTGLHHCDYLQPAPIAEHLQAINPSTSPCCTARYLEQDPIASEVHANRQGLWVAAAGLQSQTCAHYQLCSPPLFAVVPNQWTWRHNWKPWEPLQLPWTPSNTHQGPHCYQCLGLNGLSLRAIMPPELQCHHTLLTWHPATLDLGPQDAPVCLHLQIKAFLTEIIS